MRPEQRSTEQTDERAIPKLATKLADFAANLAALTPAPAQLDRDRLMYESGRMAVAAARRPVAHWLWPLSTAALALVSLGLAGAVVAGLDRRTPLAQDLASRQRPQGEWPQEANHLAGGATPGDPTSMSAALREGQRNSVFKAELLPLGSLASQSNFNMRAIILTQGPDALPSASLAPAIQTPPFGFRNGLQSLIGG